MRIPRGDEQHERKSYADLPASARAALAAYMAADCETTEDVLETVGDAAFELSPMPAQNLIDACWRARGNTMRDDFPDWAAYHEWYWRTENDEDYRDHMVDMWPVILCDGEGILDGWHRFHWYLRQGVSEIPTLRTI